MYKDVLFYIWGLPLIGSIVLSYLPRKRQRFLKSVALNFASLPFIGFLLIWAFYTEQVSQFQFVSKFYWMSNFYIILGIDSISLFFLLLTTMLIPICILISWFSVDKKYLREYLILFLILEFFLIGVFCILDILFFYIFFESVLIPMFLIIGIWGSRERKILAAYYFFFYTLIGSLIMLISILYIYYQVGTTDYETVLAFSFTNTEQKFLWFAFFLAFASKIPMVPFHLWLAEAHVEAPTAGSVILAGVLLKLGTYGFIRFSIPLFPFASFYFTPLVYTMAVTGVIYTSFTAIRQSDFKRIIAYTSIAHMNLVMLGIFSFNNIGIEGALFQSLSHGFVASALFLAIGVVYERYHTRVVKYYGGLGLTMPLYTVIFGFFTLANISFPGTSSFVGEFLILSGSLKANTSATFLSATGIVIGAAYSLWLFNRVSFGNLKFKFCRIFVDINKREFMAFLPLIIGTLLTGLLPNIFLNPIRSNVNNLMEFIYL